MALKNKYLKRVIRLAILVAILFVCMPLLFDRDDYFDSDVKSLNINHTNNFADLERPITIMPLGDSITHASRETGNYRCKLWNMLEDIGTFEFVGSMQGLVHGGQGEYCDIDHEGHAGWTSDQVLELITGDYKDYSADIVLIHLGTNDLAADQSEGSTVYEISKVIEKLRSQNQLLVTFVAGIIPNYLEDNQYQTIELNRRILNMANSLTTVQNPVIYVDQFSDFTEGDMVDRLHPNDAGAEKLAHNWFIALENYFKN